MSKEKIQRKRTAQQPQVAESENSAEETKIRVLRSRSVLVTSSVKAAKKDSTSKNQKKYLSSFKTPENKNASKVASKSAVNENIENVTLQDMPTKNDDLSKKKNLRKRKVMKEISASKPVAETKRKR